MFDIFNMLKKEEHTAPKQVTRDTIIGDILDMDQTTAPYFMEIGMHCLGCPASRGETIEEACEVHGAHTGCASDRSGPAGAPGTAGGRHRLRPRQADGGAGGFGQIPEGHRGRPAPRPAGQGKTDDGKCRLSGPR